MRLLPKNQYAKIFLIVAFILILLALGELAFLYYIPCKSTTELMFMVDSSGSVGEGNYHTVMEFCKSISQHNNVYLDKKSGVRIQAAQFSSHVIEILNFSSDEKTITTSFDESSPLGYNTQIFDSLRYISEEVIHKTRKHAKRILIFVTDGKSDPPDDIIDIVQEANRLKNDEQVVIFTVGIGESYLEEEVAGIASGVGTGKEKFMYHVNNFEALDGITGALAKEVCSPHYWLIAIPLVIIIAFWILIWYLDYRELKALEMDTGNLSENNMTLSGFNGKIVESN